MVETHTLVFYTIMVADYSFEFIPIVHCVPQFIGHNKIFLASVILSQSNSQCTISILPTVLTYTLNVIMVLVFFVNTQTND